MASGSFIDRVLCPADLILVYACKQTKDEA